MAKSPQQHDSNDNVPVAIRRAAVDAGGGMFIGDISD
jgi:hypothetical protein